MEREEGKAVAESFDWILTNRGIEEMWRGVRALKRAKEKWENSPDSERAKREYGASQRQLVQIVWEAFGESWGDLLKFEKERR